MRDKEAIAEEMSRLVTLLKACEFESTRWEYFKCQIEALAWVLDDEAPALTDPWARALNADATCASCVDLRPFGSGDFDLTLHYRDEGTRGIQFKNSRYSEKGWVKRVDVAEAIGHTDEYLHGVEWAIWQVSIWLQDREQELEESYRAKIDMLCRQFDERETSSYRAVMTRMLNRATKSAKNAGRSEIGGIPTQLLDVRDRIERYDGVLFPPCVYFLCLEGEVVYVGQSKNIHSRIRTHARDNVKVFDEVFTLAVPEEECLHVESHFIVRLQPKYNCDRDKGLGLRKALRTPK
jgi:hypothetical protein